MAAPVAAADETPNDVDAVSNDGGGGLVEEVVEEMEEVGGVLVVTFADDADVTVTIGNGDDNGVDDVGVDCWMEMAVLLLGVDVAVGCFASSKMPAS